MLPALTIRWQAADAEAWLSAAEMSQVPAQGIGAVRLEWGSAEPVAVAQPPTETEPESPNPATEVVTDLPGFRQ